MTVSPTEGKRAAEKKYYVGREIGQLKARVASLERLLERSRALVLERNKSLRGLEKGRNELLAACRRLLEHRVVKPMLCECGEPDCATTQLRAAVAKATGKHK